jgi:hypothetical protein
MKKLLALTLHVALSSFPRKTMVKNAGVKLEYKTNICLEWIFSNHIAAHFMICFQGYATKIGSQKFMNVNKYYSVPAG